MEVFMIGGCEPILPVVRWLYVRSQANEQLGSGVGVSTPCGAVSTRRITAFAPGGRNCTCIEGFLNRGWAPILRGCGEMVGFPRGATPAASPSPPDWPRAGGGGTLGQRDWGSENAGMKVIYLSYYIRTINIRTMCFLACRKLWVYCKTSMKIFST